ncbi:hypothetical protein CC78DRAFT_537991 [Lojkania enalia]|uniref:CUE domain-containing protein n=1 Tax=Lojkania enalia TaxID=147567 RepID=A0A9P4JX87_9PLEO|nr:hypothetical protein CC78DRAFT_537991 [Didymosphaeria enalia]
MAEQTLNIPQILVFLLVAFLGYRWFVAKPSSTSTRSGSQNRAVRVNPVQVDQIEAMFPQLSRRDIAYDLHKNGGNVTATTEKVLAGGRLEPAPASFNPPMPRSVPASRTPPVKPAQPDLITRYNLSSKLSATAEASASEPQKKPKAWSQDRNERQANFQRRREEMILAARRKMEEKERAKTTGTLA